MIDYTCPKCGEAMSSPDSQASQPEKCPACGNICNIPERQSVVWIARVYDKVGVTAKRVGGFCSRRRKLAAIVGVNLILLTGFLSWLLPDWLPRPVIRFEAPAKAAEGLLPSREELAKILAEYGYYPDSSGPVPRPLRGRYLRSHIYAKDCVNPYLSCIWVWSPLPTCEKEKVVAVSTEIASPKICNSFMYGRENALAHIRDGTAVIEALSSISMIPDYHDFKGASVRRVGDHEFVEASLHGKGFELEIIGEYLPVNDELVTLTLILKDKSWR